MDLSTWPPDFKAHTAPSSAQPSVIEHRQHGSSLQGPVGGIHECFHLAHRDAHSDTAREENMVLSQNANYQHLRVRKWGDVEKTPRFVLLCCRRTTVVV